MQQILVEGAQHSIPEIFAYDANFEYKHRMTHEKHSSAHFWPVSIVLQQGKYWFMHFQLDTNRWNFYSEILQKNNIFENSIYSIFQKCLNPAPESPWFLLFIPCPSISFWFLFTGFLSRSCWHAPVAWSVSPCLLHDDCTSHWSFHPPWVCTGTTVT